jgi:hypothetical protein
MDRCSSPSHIGWWNYGGRGITVCDRWSPAKGVSFENFLADMGRTQARGSRLTGSTTTVRTHLRTVAGRPERSKERTAGQDFGWLTTMRRVSPSGGMRDEPQKIAK